MTRTVLLGDVVELEQGLAINRKTKHLIKPDGDLPLLRITDLLNNKQIQFIDSKLAPKQTIAHPNDIIYTRTGQVGHVFMGKNGVIHNNSFKVVVKDDSVLPRYLYWFLKLPQTLEYMLNVASGSVQKDLGHSAFKSARFPIPDLEVQKQTVDLFDSIDEKIEINWRINEVLEQIGRTLFQNNFIDNPEVKTWPVVELGNYVELVNGASYKSSELKSSANALVTLKSFSRGGGFRRDGFKEFIGTIKDSQVVTDGDIVVAHTDVTQKAEIAGVPALVTGISKYEKVGISMDVVKVNSTDKNISSAFLYFLLRSRSFQDHKMGYISGTTVLHLNKKCIPSYKLRIPAESSILKEISDLFVPIVKSIAQNEDQTDGLAELRDSLLPRLISGKVRA